MQICGNYPCSTTDFICTDSQRAQTNLFFKNQIQPITQTTVTYEWATQFFFSDILHCTNMNTDSIDFKK